MTFESNTGWPLARRAFLACACGASAALFLTTPAEARRIRDHRDPSLGGGAYSMNVTPVVDLVIPFTAGKAIVCQTSNLTGTADPVIHVVKESGGVTQVEIARDDDSGGGLNARASFTAPGGNVRVIMRSAGFGAGAADLTCTGYKPMRNLNVGGAFKTINNYRDRDSLMSVPLPGAPRRTKLYVLDVDTGAMLRRYQSGSAETIIVTNRPPANFIVMIGSHPGTIALEPARDLPVIDGRDLIAPGGAAGRAIDRAAPPAGDAPRAPTEPDRGGAARALPGDAIIVAPPTEAVIVENPDPPGPVRLVRNDLYIAGHDPDGDGLGTELEKQIGTCSSLTEVVGNWECSRSADARDTDGDAISDRDELIGRPDRAPHLMLSRWGADPLHKDIFIEVDFMKRAQGEAPRRMSGANAMAQAALFADPETSAIYRLANAQSLNNPDLNPGVTLHMDTGQAPPPGASIAELTTYGDWGGFSAAEPVCDANGCRGATVSAVNATLFTQARRGYFHYALGYPGGGGQAPINSWQLNMPIDSPSSAAHEFGHTLGIEHSGPAGIGRDANCKPNYPSLMSYAYGGMPAFKGSFSDGYGRSALNNYALKEIGAVSQPTSGPGVAYLSHLRDIFRYNVDFSNGNVDWNRDGVFAAGTVKAYANNDQTDCEFTRNNQMIANGLTDRALSLTRIGGRTIALYVDEGSGALAADFTDFSLSCSLIGDHCGPPLTQRTVPAAWNAGILGFDAHSVGAGASARILVVYRTASGLFETTMTRDFVFTPPVQIATSIAATGEPSLGGDASRTFLAYRNANGEVVLRRKSGAGGWGAEEVARNAAGSSLGIIPGDASPGVLYARTTTGGTRLYAAIPIGASGGLSLYEFDETTGRWTRSAWSVPAVSVIGRPALAMQPASAGSPLPGRMRLLFLGRATNGNHIVKGGMLQAFGINAVNGMGFLIENHDNVWLFGKGVDLLYEDGVDTNLRAVVASALIEGGIPSPHRIIFRPHADGVVNFTYKNWNDWEAIGYGVCRSLRTGGGDITCHPWPYSPSMQSPPLPETSAPQPPTNRSECLAACAEFLTSCVEEARSACIKRAAQCRAQCRR